MGTLHRITLTGAGPNLDRAVVAFLEEIRNPNTKRSYGSPTGFA